MRVNLPATHLAKFYGPGPCLWPDLWPLKIGHKFYHEFFMQIVSQFAFVIWRLLLIPIAKVGVALKNSGNLLHHRHKNFENWFRNSLDTWGQSQHLSEAQRQKNNSYVEGGKFDLKYLSYFSIDFQNSSAYHVASFLNFAKLSHLL